MYWDVVFVKPEKNFTLHVKFANGLEGKVRFMPSSLKRSIFQMLQDKPYFETVYVDHGVVT